MVCKTGQLLSISGPDLMVLLIVSLRKQENPCLCQACFTGKQRMFFVRVQSPRDYKAIFAYTASAEIWHLHSKRRTVIISAEFGS